jgi:hypothetical protein
MLRSTILHRMLASLKIKLVLEYILVLLAFLCIFCSRHVCMVFFGSKLVS